MGCWRSNKCWSCNLSCLWLAPNAPTTNIYVYMYDDDYPGSIPTGETGTRDDPNIYVLIPRMRAVKPYLYAADYGGGNCSISDVTVPEYSYSDSRNDPAAWPIGANASVSAKFSCSYALTQAEDNILVTGQTSGDAYNIGDWDMPGTTTCTWSSWPTSYINFESGSDIDNYVTYKDYTTGWYYRCEDGTDDWILMTDQSSRLYVVYDDPLCAYDIFTKDNLETTTGWANGCTKVDTSNDSDNIPRKVQLGAKSWFGSYGYDPNTGVKPDPFTWIVAHSPNGGDCKTYADLMTKGLLILGVSASTEEIQCIDASSNRHWFYTAGLTPFWYLPGGDADGDGTIK